MGKLLGLIRLVSHYSHYLILSSILNFVEPHDKCSTRNLHVRLWPCPDNLIDTFSDKVIPALREPGLVYVSNFIIITLRS